MKIKDKLLYQSVVCMTIFALLQGTPVVNNDITKDAKDKIFTEINRNYSEKDIKNLTFMGMVGFIDPIRKEVVASIDECRTAGIKVLMITGDHPLTAFSISKELKLTDNYDEVTTGVEVDTYLKKGKKEFDKFTKDLISSAYASRNVRVSVTTAPFSCSLSIAWPRASRNSL